MTDIKRRWKAVAFHQHEKQVLLQEEDSPCVGAQGLRAV